MLGLGCHIHPAQDASSRLGDNQQDDPSGWIICSGHQLYDVIPPPDTDSRGGDGAGRAAAYSALSVRVSERSRRLPGVPELGRGAGRPWAAHRQEIHGTGTVHEEGCGAYMMHTPQGPSGTTCVSWTWHSFCRRKKKKISKNNILLINVQTSLQRHRKVKGEMWMLLFSLSFIVQLNGSFCTVNFLRQGKGHLPSAKTLCGENKQNRKVGSYFSKVCGSKESAFEH